MSWIQGQNQRHPGGQSYTHSLRPPHDVSQSEPDRKKINTVYSFGNQNHETL